MMTRTRRGWSMAEEDARTLLARIEEKIRSSQIELRQRDALIRLRAMLEEDLYAGLDRPGDDVGGTRDMSPPGSVLPVRG